MRKSEFFTKISLILIAILALVAVYLQILNEKTTAIESIYEIITFSVALAAVILAVLQGLENAKVTRELRKITREIKENLAEIEAVARIDQKLWRKIAEIDRDNESIAKILRNDVKLDRAVLEKISEKSSKGNNIDK